MQPEPIVYVIDDDDAVRQSLEFLLKTAGVSVRGFDSAKAFLDVLPAIKSGCIITDVRMPEITGIDLLRRLKESGLDVPVIVITGHGDISGRGAGRRKGRSGDENSDVPSGHVRGRPAGPGFGPDHRPGAHHGLPSRGPSEPGPGIPTQG